ncbi:MAG: methyl-accepting chemotaxis protein [Oscillospiraceae bacterium]|jgi:methyl-accepting chemotaxis protein|nr:methyl-accepting chemotaxis protein [Oscillospiraceae bacterium]
MVKRKPTISGRLVSTVSLILIAAMLLITVVSTVTLYNVSVSEAQATLEEATDALANKVDGWIEKIKTAVSINAIVAEKMYRDDGVEEMKPDFAGYVALIKQSNSEFSDVYAGFPDGGGVFGSGWVPDASYDVRTRPWYKGPMASPGKLVVDAPYWDVANITIALAFGKTIGNGTDIGVAVVDVFLSTVEEMVDAANGEGATESLIIGTNGDVYVTTNDVLRPDQKTGEFKNLVDFDGGKYSAIFKGIQSGEIFTEKDGNGVNQYYTSTVMPSTGWYIVSKIPTNVVLAGVTRSVITMIILFIVVLGLSIFILRTVVKKVVISPIGALSEAAKDIAMGIVDVKIANQERFIGAFEELSVAFNTVIGGIKQQSKVLSDISDGDYTEVVDIRSEQDVLNRSINRVIVRMNETFQSIHKVSGDVATRATEISDVSFQLSQTTSEQAATVQQISATVTEIHDQTENNTKIAKEAADLANSIKDNAVNGNRQMTEMTKAVQEINEASQSINKVIKVIDDIAFQTNILALNAAVEAARAGSAGKGFAVVAEEVRSLASKSAEAAKETGDLIANSIVKAEVGARIAGETAASLVDVVEGISRSTELIGKIASSSEDQNAAISQIDTAIQQVSDVVSRNSATAEESAAYSQELSNLSSELEEQLKRFRLMDDEQSALAERKRPKSLPPKS